MMKVLFPLAVVSLLGFILPALLGGFGLAFGAEVESILSATFAISLCGILVSALGFVAIGTLRIFAAAFSVMRRTDTV